MELKPWHDCPACPSCSARVGCPARNEEPGRWNGPPDSNLFCPACGTGWVGTGEELGQAEFSYRAWEEHERVQSGRTRLLSAVRRCVDVISDEKMHNAGKGQAVYELYLFLSDGMRNAEGHR